MIVLELLLAWLTLASILIFPIQQFLISVFALICWTEYSPLTVNDGFRFNQIHYGRWR
jgi:hypothetical protein